MLHFGRYLLTLAVLRADSIKILFSHLIPKGATFGIEYSIPSKRCFSNINHF